MRSARASAYGMRPSRRTSGLLLIPVLERLLDPRHELIGHGAVYYGAAALAEQDLIDAAVDDGFWRAGRSFAPRRSSRGALSSRNRGTLYPGAL